MGIATVNQAGSIGAIGATLMAGYRLFEGKKSAFYPLILILGSIIPITFLASNYELNVKNLEERNIGAIYTTAFFVIILVYGIACYSINKYNYKKGGSINCTYISFF